MLNIYIGKENLPHGMYVIEDADKIDAGLNLVKNDYSKNAVKEIEDGIAIEPSKFIDRLGGILYASNLSTSCKIAIAMDQLESFVTADEIGNNAIRYILKNATKGLLFFNYFNDIPDVIMFPVNINGKVCRSLSDFYAVIARINLCDYFQQN